MNELSLLDINVIFPEVLIIGDSIVRHGGDYAFEHRYDQLGQSQYRIMWLGQGGMHWDQLFI